MGPWGCSVPPPPPCVPARFSGGSNGFAAAAAPSLCLSSIWPFGRFRLLFYFDKVVCA